VNPGSSRFLIACAVIVLFLNVFLLFYAIPHLSSRMGILYNQDKYADGYDELATSLAHGDGYRFYPDTAPTLMREPGYPFLLAGIFRIFGNNLTAVKIVNLLLAFATAALLMKIAAKISGNPVVVFGSALLFLFPPGVLSAESRGGVETLFTFCVVLFVLLLYRALETDSWLDYVACGCALGLTVLVRSTLMLFPIIALACLLVIFKRKLFPSTIKIGLTIASMLLILSPWIIRNFQLTGKFVPTASVLGISAHSGQYVCENLTNENSRKDVDRRGAAERRRLAIELGLPFKDVQDAYYQYFYNTGDELRFSSFLMNRVTDKYKSSPDLFVSCASSNLFDFWFAGKTNNSTKMNIALQIPYLLLAIGGFVVSWRKHQIQKVIVPIALIIYTIAVYAPILAQARYSVSVVPFVSVLACVALAHIFAMFGEKRPVFS